MVQMTRLCSIATRTLSAVIFSVFLGFAVVLTAGGVTLATSTSAQAAVVSSVNVRGNTRMDSETIKSFLTIKPGKSFDNGDIDDSVKALFGTGLFGDVSIYQSGSTLIVEITENSTINEVFFEGNKRLKDPALSSSVQSKPRGIYSSITVASDVDLIRQAYSRVGRSDAVITSEIVPLANNRVNVVFRVNEGGKTKIGSITFVGNNAYREARLREVLSTKRSNVLSWLKNDDIYDPDRVAADEEVLRRFYFNSGYADFQILSTSAVLDEAENVYSITITVDEGNKYTFGAITIESTLDGVDAESLYGKLETKSGKSYSAKKVEDTIVNLTSAVAARGFAFVEVTPRGDRDFATNTISIAYLIDQGNKVYVERIQIIGNERSREFVIRREFDISEGDAFNQVYVQQTKRRLDALGLFERVEISTSPGSAPDKVVIIVRVEDKASGEFSVGGGYSTSDGALGEISFTEKNFMGRGQLLRISGSFGDAEQNYRLSFTEPYFLGYRLSAGFDISQSVRNASSTSAYGSETLSGVLRFGVPLTSDLGFTGFYTYNDSSTTISKTLLDLNAGGTDDGIQGNRKGELSAAFAPPFSPQDWVSSGFGYSLVYNTLDDAITPRSGMRLEFTQTAFGAGGDAQFLRSDAKAQLNATLSEDLDLVGMVRGRAGATTIFNAKSGYRAFDNYFQGPSSIRGFASNGFGPRDPGTGDALGGQYYWNATAEVNFPAPFLPESFGIRGAMFADAGSLWGVDDRSRGAIAASNGTLSSKLGSVDDTSVRASVGASLIWNSPFGPLRFDYSEPVVREKYDNIRRFNFGISSSF